MFDFSVDVAMNEWNERNHGGVILIIGDKHSKRVPFFRRRLFLRNRSRV